MSLSNCRFSSSSGGGPIAPSLLALYVIARPLRGSRPDSLRGDTGPPSPPRGDSNVPPSLFLPSLSLSFLSSPLSFLPANAFVNALPMLAMANTSMHRKQILSCSHSLVAHWNRSSKMTLHSHYLPSSMAPLSIRIFEALIGGIRQAKPDPLNLKRTGGSDSLAFSLQLQTKTFSRCER